MSKSTNEEAVGKFYSDITFRYHISFGGDQCAPIDPEYRSISHPEPARMRHIVTFEPWNGSSLFHPKPTVDLQGLCDKSVNLFRGNHILHDSLLIRCHNYSDHAYRTAHKQISEVLMDLTGFRNMTIEVKSAGKTAYVPLRRAIALVSYTQGAIMIYLGSR